MKLIRYLFLSIRAFIALPVGSLYFLIFKRTPQISYQAMVWLFCISGGKSNDFISSCINFIYKKKKIKNTSGILGDLNSDSLKTYSEKLKKDGYIVFPKALDDDLCHRLQKFAYNQDAHIRMMDGQSITNSKKIKFDSNNLKAVRYDFYTKDLLDKEDVQDLLVDGSLLAIAQEYLGTFPVADVLSMWWHTNFSNIADSEAAQLFHFDMDRPKWLKIFIYLTDVGDTNGAHNFVKGSHQTGAIPKDILERGYVRLSDEEIVDRFGEDKIIPFTGPKGTIIIEDTRGLHKGAVVSSEPRLMLQLQLSNSLFGTNYPKANISNTKSNKVKDFIKTYPSFLQQYTK